MIVGRYVCNCNAEFTRFALLMRHISQFREEPIPYKATTLHDYVRTKITEPRFVCVAVVKQERTGYVY